MDTEKNSAPASIRKVSVWQTTVLLVVVVATVGALSLAFSGSNTKTQSLDADLCPTDSGEISGSNMLLYDFVKPLSSDQAELPSNLLREVGRSMERNAELSVFSLADAPAYPGILLKRLCKPYANSDLRVGMAGDQDARRTLPECDSLPAQLPSEVRKSATAFCTQLQSLGNKLNAMVRTEWPADRKVQNAHLAEALHDMAIDLRDRPEAAPEPHAIYVVSDMMQHANWYSHLEREWSDWDYEAFAKLMAAQISGNASSRGAVGKRVEIFYIPRRGLTDQARARWVHQRFWRSYFAGSNITFHNQLTAPAYSVNSFMNALTDTEQASQERLAPERLWRQIREEPAQLQEEERSQLEPERNRQQLLNTEPTIAEASDERSGEMAERKEQEAPPKKQEEVSAQPLLAPSTGDAPAPDEAQPPPREAPRPQQDRIGSQPPPEPTPEDEGGANVGDREAPPPLEATDPGRAAETADSVAQPVVPEVPAQGQSTSDQEPTLEQAPVHCALQPWQETGNRGPDYPRGGRMNLGSATITVRFEVDAQGATVDEEVAVVVDESQSERERYFELFADAAEAAVREWQLAFVEPAEAGCVRRHTDTVEFKFEYSGRFYPTRNVR